MKNFTRQLRRIRRHLRAGRLLAAVVALAALAAGLWLGFGLLDALAAFEPNARRLITIALLLTVMVTGLLAIFRALRISLGESAKRADTALRDSRHPATAALSLDASVNSSPLAALLTERTLDAAAASLTRLPMKRILPWHLLRRASLALAVPLLLLGILSLAAPSAFSTIASRLLHPASDIPPYSPLVFKIQPEKPAAVYGGELQLTAEITGAPLEHPVECWVRRPRTNEILRMPAFRESLTRLSRKLDGLTEPVEIAFATGKARSHWHAVEILLEPKILAGNVNLTPPRYTGLASSSFALDTNEIAAVEGSEVTLELTSNRPLASGSLVFTPANAPGVEAIPEIYQATISTPNAASFTFTSTRPGRLVATVSDLRGTPAPQPLDLALRSLPDRPPAVDLASPPRQMLATPKSVIPIHGTAEDDYALSRMHFVRTLSGFRDRVRVIAPALRDKTYQFEDRLDLDELGLEAGQIIELMLEASDHNPSLLGRGSSEISRIKIISEDQYAEYIRTKTTIGEFSTRFRAAREAIERAREALEKLREAREENDPDAAAKALAEAREAHRQAAELLDKIAGDFPAFELEKRLQELAEKQADALRENLEALGNPDGGDIDEMIERLGRQREQAEELDEDVALAREAAKLLEMAAKFRQIYENQKSVAKRFGTVVEEIRRGENQNRRLLPSLAETQEKNRAALDSFKTELRERLDVLGDRQPLLAPLVDSAFEFLDQLDAAAPETLMDAATTHGKAGQANDAFTNAELARALLERLMSEPEPFPQAAMGVAPKFKVPRPDVNANIEQMLRALLGQNGGGEGGTGEGQGGFGADGSAMSGYSMDLPVIGPDRLEFEPLAGASESGDGKGAAGQVAPLPENAEAGSLTPTETRDGQSSTVSPESIPEPYREAVKRYFTP